MQLNKPQAKNRLFGGHSLVLSIQHTDCYLEVEITKLGKKRTKTEYFNMLTNRFLKMAEEALDKPLSERNVVYYDRVEERTC